MGLPKDCGLDLHSKWPSGKRNLITDIPGVKVGHATLKSGEIHTGVTAVLPHGGNLFQEKVMAGSAVINGFGKSLGLVQIQELGTIETPILMTNTLSVGTAAEALVKYMLKDNPDIGISTGTVNCVVTECNDGNLNDIRGLHVKEAHVLEAIENASEDFEEGAVGGGTGMVCLGLKGGIGSASRIIQADGKDYTVGAIVMSNFGSPGNLVIGGDHIGARIKEKLDQTEKKDKGSIITILATDIPLTHHQLERIAHRAIVGLSRTGSYCGNGSGEIVIAFSTGNHIPHYPQADLLPLRAVADTKINLLFRAVAECVEESVLSSLLHAETVTGRGGLTVRSLADLLTNPQP